MAAICSRATDSEIGIRRDAFDCLTRVADIYYGRIGPYIDHLAGLTYTAATGEQEVRFLLADAGQHHSFSSSC
jgi:hypothetical protein